MKERFYVTTPIYYVNDAPHIGHAYTTVAADILARHNRVLGKRIFFLTGTDEHGQKIEKAASEKGRTPKEHADIMVANFKELWLKLNISSDAFMRTTDKEHIRVVQELMQKLLDKGEIEKRSYSGWYCTPDERFWTEKDIVDGNCPECGRAVDNIQEQNYFFLMSKYQERLIRYIDDHPSYILPDTRRNEVLGFLKNNVLGDLCISRPKQRLSWGIPLPFDPEYVTYVWFDALVNYYSATTYLAPGEEVRSSENSELRTSNSELNWWPASHHLIGKDILTTHAVYWSTMLMALDMPLPGNIFAHGWWTLEGKKMSKSLGNVVDPNVMADKYGVDAFRYFLFREVPFGLDGDFSEEALINRINTDLANDLGNLMSRFLTMADRYLQGTVSQPAPDTSIRPVTDEHKKECMKAVSNSMDDRHWSHLRFNIILENIWDVVGATNNLIAKTEPWRLAENDHEAVSGVLSGVWNALRLTAASVYPFMPETAERMWKHLGLRALTEEATGSADIFRWEWSPGYEIKVSKGERQLFPRIEKERGKPAEKAKNTEQKKVEPKMTGQGTQELIGIEDFARVELRVGRVMSAERVEKSDKLIKLKVDIGEERQIVAGIGKSYTTDELVGKKIVVVSNLKPVKLMGTESQGMLLAATDEDGTCSVLMPEREVKEGSRVK